MASGPMTSRPMASRPMASCPMQSVPWLRREVDSRTAALLLRGVPSDGAPDA
ncbi:hypothetical protein ABH925_000563 [Streptacidiphilus sp. EB129]